MSNRERENFEDDIVLLYRITGLVFLKFQDYCRFYKKTPILLYFIYRISVSLFLIIISVKSYPSLFPLLTHRSAYPNSEFPA